MERASSARQSICSTDLKPSTFGDAFSGGLTRPRHCTRARSHTSDGQLAEEHAWMSTKLPPQSPHKRLGEEPMNIEHLSLNNSSASALSLGLDHHSTFSLEADFLEASTVPGVRMGSIANEEAADSMEVLGSGLKDMNLDDDRKELMRKDMKYPQDAPEGRKLDHRAIASEKVENLPHKGYFEASYGPLKKVKAVRSGVFNSSKNVEKMRVIGQYSRNDLQTDPTTMFDQDFKPTLGMRRFSDQGPVNPYKKNNETFEVHKSAQHFDHEDELEEGSEGVHKEGRSAKFVSEKKKGKQPIYPGCMDKPYMSEEDDNLVDVDLNDKDDGPGGKQNDEYVDEWLSNECDEAMEVEEA
ncbi:MAG: hypothetical protein M1822_002698 [Bathelium mastoideum]|nr:MAG: hypothetical protein M1822_002698 [Bathelium mastoideum]